jgi:GNAT superfamily N-acetyltransferase
MTAEDVAQASEMMVQGEWGDRSAFLGWAVREPTCHTFVADGGGEIIGTGIATSYGTVGWVGTIFVRTDRRGSGLGKTLTRVVIEDLERRGCRTLVLIATPAGRPIYERLGFAHDIPYLRVTAPGLAAGDVEAGVRPFAAADLAEMIALDRAASGGDRSAVLRSLASAESARLAVSTDGGVGGFLIRAPWGNAALIARAPEEAVRLLDWRRRRVGPEGHVTAGLLEANAAGRARLAAEGWVEEGGGTRMIRGEALDWRPEWIWGQFGGALG